VGRSADAEIRGDVSSLRDSKDAAHTEETAAFVCYTAKQREKGGFLPKENRVRSISTNEDAENVDEGYHVDGDAFVEEIEMVHVVTQHFVYDVVQ
jgi:hypothetical protein